MAIKSVILNCLFISFLCCALQSKAQHKITFVNNTFTCQGIHTTSENFHIFTKDAFQKTKNSQAILGSTQLDDRGKIIFHPLIELPLDSDFIGICNDEMNEIHIPIPENYQVPQVVNIFPSSLSWPSNILKFYIMFSRPMSRIAYPYIQIIDSNGKILDRAILKEIPELWNEDHTLLTVWLEPGRIKRDLGPNLTLGPIFNLNKTYEVKIGENLKDQNGVGIGYDFQFTFSINVPDRKKINPHKWGINIPDSESITPLEISFDEILDYGSLKNNFQVLNDHNNILNGHWEISEKSDRIKFYPERNWQSGNYSIIIYDEIEDLAGNRISRLFDQPVRNEDNKEVNVPRPITLVFTIN